MQGFLQHRVLCEQFDLLCDTNNLHSALLKHRNAFTKEGDWFLLRAKLKGTFGGSRDRLDTPPPSHVATVLVELHNTEI